MKVGDVVRIIGLKVGENRLYNHQLIGIVIDTVSWAGSVDVMFGIICRRLHPKYLEVISEGR